MNKTSKQGNIKTIGLIILILVSIITASSTVYFYQESIAAKERVDELNQQLLNIQYTYSSIRESVICINVTLNYGNGTINVNDAVYLAPKQTVFDALKIVAQVNATYWDAYQSWLIDAINDIENNENSNNRWWVYSVNGEHALVSADAYELIDGDQVEWIYQQY